jgi:hypothetical protein
LNKEKRDQGYWKLNTSLLTDLKYIYELKQMLDEKHELLQNIIDKQVRWEKVKSIIKDFSVYFSKQKSLDRKQKITTIEKEIEMIDIQQI